MWTQDHWIENVARFPAGCPGHTRSPTVAGAGYTCGAIPVSTQQRSHARRPLHDSHAAHPLHGLMTFCQWYTILQEQISLDLIDDRMETQLHEITSRRQRAILRSDNFDIDMYADVMQHGTAWCRGHTERDALGSIMRELPMLASQQI